MDCLKDNNFSKKRINRTKRRHRLPCGGRSIYALFAQVHFGKAENLARALNQCFLYNRKLRNFLLYKKGSSISSTLKTNFLFYHQSTNDGAVYILAAYSASREYNPFESPPKSSIFLIISSAFFSSSSCSFTNQSRNCIVLKSLTS